MKKRVIYTLFILISIFSLRGQNHTLHVNIEGIDYDTIRLILALPSSSNSLIRINGETENKKKWVFRIPDSVFTSYYLSGFGGREIKGDSIIKSSIIFKTQLGTTNSLFFDDTENIHLNLKFENKRDKENYRFSIQEDGTDPQILLSTMFLKKYFSWGDGSIPYEQIIENYIGLVNEYNDSYVLSKFIKMISSWVKVEDLEVIYSLFSEKVKEPV